MSNATQQNLEDARIDALSKDYGFDCFFEFRDWLDTRFPNVIFSLEQEEDIWFSVPK